MIKTKICKKFNTITAIMLVLVFVITSAVPAYPYGNATLFKQSVQPEKRQEVQGPVAAIDILNDPQLFSVPSEIGSVIDAYKGTSGQIVINIQDRHADPVCQFNIAKIIDMAARDSGTKLICLEGADADLDTSFYDKFHESEKKSALLKHFVNKAIFTGAEFYKLSNKSEQVRATGAEDRNTYLRHLDAYRKNFAAKSDIAGFINSLSDTAAALREKAYTDELKKMDALSQDYAASKIELKDYTKTLIGYAGKAKVDMSKYPDLAKFTELTEAEAKIDFKKAETERDELVRSLSLSLREDGLKRLLAKSLEFRAGKLPPDEFYAFLVSHLGDAGREGLKAEYTDLIAYADYLKLSKSFDHFKLFDQASGLSGDIMLASCSSPAQKDVVLYSKAIRILQDLYSLKLNHKQYNYMNANPSYFSFPNIKAFIKSASLQYGVGLLSAPQPIDPRDFEYSKQFYKIAFERDMALTNNTLTKMRINKSEKAMLVTGGFHTDGITNILRQKGISYIVVCPNVGAGDYDAIYEARMNNVLPTADELKDISAETLAAPVVTSNLDDGRLAGVAQDAAASALGEAEAPAVQAAAAEEAAAATDPAEMALKAAISMDEAIRLLTQSLTIRSGLASRIPPEFVPTLTRMQIKAQYEKLLKERGQDDPEVRNLRSFIDSFEEKEHPHAEEEEKFKDYLRMVNIDISEAEQVEEYPDIQAAAETSYFFDQVANRIEEGQDVMILSGDMPSFAFLNTDDTADLGHSTTDLVRDAYLRSARDYLSKNPLPAGIADIITYSNVYGGSFCMAFTMDKKVKISKADVEKFFAAMNEHALGEARKYARDELGLQPWKANGFNFVLGISRPSSAFKASLLRKMNLNLAKLSEFPKEAQEIQRRKLSIGMARKVIQDSWGLINYAKNKYFAEGEHRHIPFAARAVRDAYNKQNPDDQQSLYSAPAPTGIKKVFMAGMGEKEINGWIHTWSNKDENRASLLPAKFSQKYIYYAALLDEKTRLSNELSKELEAAKKGEPNDLQDVIRRINAFISGKLLDIYMLTVPQATDTGFAQEAERAVTLKGVAAINMVARRFITTAVRRKSGLVVRVNMDVDHLSKAPEAPGDIIKEEGPKITAEEVSKALAKRGIPYNAAVAEKGMGDEFVLTLYADTDRDTLKDALKEAQDNITERMHKLQYYGQEIRYEVLVENGRHMHSPSVSGGTVAIDAATDVRAGVAAEKTEEEIVDAIMDKMYGVDEYAERELNLGKNGKKEKEKELTRLVEERKRLLEELKRQATPDAQRPINDALAYVGEQLRDAISSESSTIFISPTEDIAPDVGQQTAQYRLYHKRTIPPILLEFARQVRGVKEIFDKSEELEGPRSASETEESAGEENMLGDLNAFLAGHKFEGDALKQVLPDERDREFVKSIESLPDGRYRIGFVFQGQPVFKEAATLADIIFEVRRQNNLERMTMEFLQGAPQEALQEAPAPALVLDGRSFVSTVERGRPDGRIKINFTDGTSQECDREREGHYVALHAMQKIEEGNLDTITEILGVKGEEDLYEVVFKGSDKPDPLQLPITLLDSYIKMRAGESEEAGKFANNVSRVVPLAAAKRFNIIFKDGTQSRGVRVDRLIPAAEAYDRAIKPVVQQNPGLIRSFSIIPEKDNSLNIFFSNGEMILGVGSKDVQSIVDQYRQAKAIARRYKERGRVEDIIAANDPGMYIVVFPKTSDMPAFPKSGPVAFKDIIRAVAQRPAAAPAAEAPGEPGRQASDTYEVPQETVDQMSQASALTNNILGDQYGHFGQFGSYSFGLVMTTLGQVTESDRKTLGLLAQSKRSLIVVLNEEQRTKLQKEYGFKEGSIKTIDEYLRENAGEQAISLSPEEKVVAAIAAMRRQVRTGHPIGVVSDQAAGEKIARAISQSPEKERMKGVFVAYEKLPDMDIKLGDKIIAKNDAYFLGPVLMQLFTAFEAFASNPNAAYKILLGIPPISDKANFTTWADTAHRSILATEEAA